MRIGREQVSVGVIGGGIGGLAAALSLLQAGFDVHVYERAHALSEVGHRFQRLEDHGDRVAVAFANKSTTSVDVLVGADGIHSDVRSALFGPEGPVFTGCAAYRGLVPAERLAHLELEVTAQIWMGPGAHFVHYFVQQQRLVNFVAIFDQDSWTRESWTDRGEVQDALAAFEGWHPQVHAIIGAVDETFIWALFDRPPLPRWSKGRATLLGDACHPMLPFMAQGAAQGLEDGATLTACLIAGPDVPRALGRYQQLRLPRASKIQAMSSENKRRFHLPDGPDQQERDARMASGSTDFARKAVEWIYAHDARAV